MSRHRPKYSKMFYLFSKDMVDMNTEEFWGVICNQCKCQDPEICADGTECIKQIKIYYQNKAEGGK